MPSAKVFDQNSIMPTAVAAASAGMSIPIVINPLKQHSISKKNAEKNEEEKMRDQMRAEELKTYRDSLEDGLIQKLDELKRICLQEAEITGLLPIEIYLTLHPDETLPKIKRRVGTTFAIPDDVFANAGTDDKLVSIETDIKMQKEIIAATERMSKDKFINKSLRKKHRRDLQSAHSKLRNMQKGLSQMRLSMSKPDVSNIDGSETSSSGISRIKNWSWSNKNSQDFSMSAKSCPTTPRGSIPDLCDSDERSSNCSRAWNKSPAPSSSSVGHLRPPTTSTASATSITTNTSPNDSGIHSETTPPSLPSRRMTLPSTAQTSPRSRNQNATKSIEVDETTSPIYENVGYTSVAPYKSAYRQSNYPTLQNREEISEPNLRSLLYNNKISPALKGGSSPRTHFTKSTTNNNTGATNFSITSNSSSHFPKHNTITPTPTQDNSLITSAANTQLGRIVRKMSNNNGVSAAYLASLHHPPQNSNQHRLSMANPATTATVRASSVHGVSGFSTASLDRRALRQRQAAMTTTTNETFNPQNLTTTFPVGVGIETQAEGKQQLQPQTNIRSISQTNGIGIGVPHCTVNPRHHSTSRLPPGGGGDCWQQQRQQQPYPSRDPQMEALLNFYRDGVFSASKKLIPIVSSNNSTPTTRIVPIQQKPSSNSTPTSTKGATMV